MEEIDEGGERRKGRMEVKVETKVVIDVPLKSLYITTCMHSRPLTNIHNDPATTHQALAQQLFCTDTKYGGIMVACSLYLSTELEQTVLVMGCTGQGKTTNCNLFFQEE